MLRIDGIVLRIDGRYGNNALCRLQRVAACCSVLQRVAACYSVLLCSTACCSALHVLQMDLLSQHVSLLHLRPQ